MRRITTRPALVATAMAPLLAASIGLAGCGSSHKSAGSTGSTTPTTEATTATTATAGSTTTLDPVVESHPCSLVTQAEATAILHETLKAPVQAPQGPTCIFESTAGTVVATLVVEREAFTTIQHNVQHIQPAVESGHTTYCGVYGKPTLFAPLPQNATLVITAACAPARQLAAKALARLAG